MSTMPPQALGLEDQARAARLALAVFDDDRQRYDAAMKDALGAGPELVYALTRNWIQALVEHQGTARARVRVERILAGITEHYAELAEQKPPMPDAADDFDPEGDEPW
ncbi:hypothetical protein [Mycobacterium camsae]|uniref:hypothetical protein n=1 Tax=Mycobacterium gordonae TaxID=1778 RepID=UPI001982625F|nr:hypothetical protein [Mycobacterium gordonae]